MSVPDSVIEEYAKALIVAEDTRTPIEPITKKYPGLSLEDAYKIQLRLIEEKTRRGEVIIGKKVGLTSKAMQELGGVFEPDYGFLTDRMVVFEDFPIKLSELIYPAVEAEIAFVLKGDLEGPGVLVSDVLRATDYVMPCLEVIDGRTIRYPGEWRVENSILDNAAACRVVFGGKRCDQRSYKMVVISCRCALYRSSHRSHHERIYRGKRGADHCRCQESGPGPCTCGGPVGSFRYRTGALCVDRFGSGRCGCQIGERGGLETEQSSFW